MGKLQKTFGTLIMAGGLAGSFHAYNKGNAAYTAIIPSDHEQVEKYRQSYVGLEETLQSQLERSIPSSDNLSVDLTELVSSPSEKNGELSFSVSYDQKLVSQLRELKPLCRFDDSAYNEKVENADFARFSAYGWGAAYGALPTVLGWSMLAFGSSAPKEQKRRWK